MGTCFKASFLLLDFHGEIFVSKLSGGPVPDCPAKSRPGVNKRQGEHFRISLYVVLGSEKLHLRKLLLE